LATEAARAELTTRKLDYRSSDANVVRAISDKAHTHALAVNGGHIPDTLATLIHVLTPEQLTAPDAVTHIERLIHKWWPHWTGGGFILKPRIGVSSRGRFAGKVDRAGEIPAKTLRRLAARGGAMLEPWLERVQDYSVQLVVHPGGRVEVLGTTQQIVTGTGGYLGNRGRRLADGRIVAGDIGDTGDIGDHQLTGPAVALAEAVAAEGFVGPCGVDAFTYRRADGTVELRPLVELNARFTTATIVLGLLRRAEAAGLLGVGDTSWLFELTASAEQPGARVTLGFGKAAPALWIGDERPVNPRRRASEEPTEPGH
jgi:hypothetical protein